MINRLLGIVYILLNKKNMTAAALAEHFEVSVRTIYRDIEILSQAGIPVYARKGKNGGICLMEQFVLNKMLITPEEQQEILSALLSMKETNATEEKEILQKLGGFFKTQPMNWISIDFSDWGDGQKQLFEVIKKAILTQRVITFD
ncbi:MAG: HTH domain-containing protein, partial [Lachnospiraceae bacterium]|nr:HTH domain-containing protein [Lachnospiraceae bacterium]